MLTEHGRDLEALLQQHSEGQDLWPDAEDREGAGAGGGSYELPGDVERPQRRRRLEPRQDDETPMRDSSREQLRAHAMECLRRHGGSCTLAQAAEDLGLREASAEVYNATIAVLKEIAFVERPGEGPPLLRLR